MRVPRCIKRFLFNLRGVEQCQKLVIRSNYVSVISDRINFFIDILLAQV
jgi:hypothetical protein